MWDKNLEQWNWGLALGALDTRRSTIWRRRSETQTCIPRPGAKNLELHSLQLRLEKGARGQMRGKLKEKENKNKRKRQSEGAEKQ